MEESGLSEILVVTSWCNYTEDHNLNCAFYTPKNIDSHSHFSKGLMTASFHQYTLHLVDITKKTSTSHREAYLFISKFS
jgi:hypothetical protein